MLRQLQEGGFSPASVEIQSPLRAAWQSMTWRSCLWPSVLHLRRGDSLVIVRTADEHAPRGSHLGSGGRSGGMLAPRIEGSHALIAGLTQPNGVAVA